MKQIVLALASPLFLAAMSAPACSKYATPSGACADGPRWPRGTNFEYERDGPTDAPACTPHCGPNQAASSNWPRGFLTSDALPSGFCDEDGVVCTMAAEWIGPCPPEGKTFGPLNKFICRCRSENWTCTIDATSPSASVQSCTLPDGRDFYRPDSGYP